MLFSNNTGKFENSNGGSCLWPRGVKMGISGGKIIGCGKCFIIIVNSGVQAKREISEAEQKQALKN